MKASSNWYQFISLSAFVAATALVACSDDSDDSDTGATGGSSGSGATGGSGGSGATGGSAGATGGSGGSGATGGSAGATGGSGGSGATGGSAGATGGSAGATGGSGGSGATGGSGGSGATGGSAGSGATGGSAGSGGGPVPAGWLYTEGNHIYIDGAVFHGRGANLHDTRSCWACAWAAPNPDEVKRRLDELLDSWGANFVRLALESYASPESGMVQWQNVLDDPEYLADIVEIVDHIGSKSGKYVLLSLWVDGSFTDLGWPAAETRQEWEKLAETFRDSPHVMFGLVNEPQENWNGNLDAQVWDAMNSTVQAIRDVEDGFGTPHHVITVQGTRAWARNLDYYVTHPHHRGWGREHRV